MASLDWSAQELRIAAAISKDPELQRIAALPDPYIGLAAAVGLAAPTDTKATNPKGRKIDVVRYRCAHLRGEGWHDLAGSRSFPPPPKGDVRSILSLVGRGRRARDAMPPAQDAARLDPALPRGHDRQGAGSNGEELPDSGRRRRHDAARDGVGDRGRDLHLRVLFGSWGKFSALGLCWLSRDPRRLVACTCEGNPSIALTRRFGPNAA